MEENQSLSHQAYTHVTLFEVVSIFNLNFLHSPHFAYTENKQIEIDFQVLKKAVWLCSILADSDMEAHRIRAQRFASLLYLTNADKNDNDYIIGVCYILFSRFCLLYTSDAADE